MMVFIIAILLSHPSTQFGCGPFFDGAIFTFSVHPDFPLEKFAAGDLGVLRPGYARSYLTIAYRYMIGISLDQQEQKAALSVWHDRLSSGDVDSSAWVKAWLDARAKLPEAAKPTDALPIQIDATKNITNKDYYLTFLNCHEDAFRSAVTTLDRLTRQFNGNNDQLKDWVYGQDTVFKNCSGGPAIPIDEAANAPAQVRAERNYQIAAANFYAGNFDEAEKRFTQIGTDNSSPWKVIAPYLAVRCLVRKATLTGTENKVDTAVLQQAKDRLQKVLSDRNESTVYPAANRLMGYIRFRLDPETRIHELAQAVLQKNSGQTFYQNLWDYTDLISNNAHDDQDERKFDQLPTIGRQDDLTDWVLVFQVQDSAALDYSLKKYEQTSSLPWLAAAISKIDVTNPKASNLIDAVAKVKPSSPAYPTVEYHRLRLMIESGKKVPARTELDGLLAAGKNTLPASARNQFLSLRMRVASGLDDFLKYAQRNASALSINDDGREIPDEVGADADYNKALAAKLKLAMFDDDAATVLNERFPLSVLKDAAESKVLPSNLRRQLSMAVWVRAILLDKDDIAQAIAPELAQLAPEMKDLLADYEAASSPEARRYAALYSILKIPGTRPIVNSGVERETALAEIDNFRDNWWCALNQPVPKSDTAKKNKESFVKTVDGSEFLTAPQKSAAATEHKRLLALDTAPNYLCMQVVNWANEKGDDPRVPEALYLAVRATRYGCTNDSTGKFSKQAFDLLHKNYPKSTWAEKTKYWYK